MAACSNGACASKSERNPDLPSPHFSVSHLAFDSVLGTFKLVILILVAFSGFAALNGKTRGPTPDNFTNAFEGSRNDIYGIASCIYNVSRLRRSVTDSMLTQLFQGRLELRWLR